VAALKGTIGAWARVAVVAGGVNATVGRIAVMGWMRRQTWKALTARRGRVQPNLAMLRECQYLTPIELARLQHGLLRDLLLHAYDSTNYYRRVLGSFDVVSSDGAVDLSRWSLNASGGSTGEPAHFVQDSEFDAWAAALKLLFDEWTGCRMGDRKVLLWGSRRDVDGSKNPMRTEVGRWLRNERWLRAYGVTDGDMMSHARAINAFRPVQVLAYVESAYELSREVERLGITMYSPRAVMTSAGALYPAMRETITRAFRAPVFDRYGSREVGDVACECDRHQGLHVAVPCQYVEILRSDGSAADPGEEGDIVITNLANYAMPFIRYSIGDTGKWATQPCTCGRTWPLIARVTGRVCDTFITRDGARVAGEYFVHELRTQDWVRRFRLIQEAVDRVDVYLQPAREPGQADLERLDEIRSLVRGAMGQDCAVNIQIVPEIEPMSSGKYLYVISRVGSLDDARI
jgi:phenylacetate-CoA ligase